MRETQIVLGQEGIAVARAEFLNGCVQYGVKPKTKEDGTMQSVEYFDVEQLEVIGAGVSVPVKTTGGPQRDAPSGSYRG